MKSTKRLSVAILAILICGLAGVQEPKAAPDHTSALTTSSAGFVQSAYTASNVLQQIQNLDGRTGILYRWDAVNEVHWDFIDMKAFQNRKCHFQGMAVTYPYNPFQEHADRFAVGYNRKAGNCSGTDLDSSTKPRVLWAPYENFIGERWVAVRQELSPTPGRDHNGGMQSTGYYVAVGIDGNDEADIQILFLETSDWSNKRVLVNSIDQDQYTKSRAEAVAIVQQANGKFLLVSGQEQGRNLILWESTGTDIETTNWTLIGQRTSPSGGYSGYYGGSLGSQPDDLNFNNLALIRETGTDDIYLLGLSNHPYKCGVWGAGCGNTYLGDQSVIIPFLYDASSKTFTRVLLPNGKDHAYLKPPCTGSDACPNFVAGGTVFVNSGGNIEARATEHWPGDQDLDILTWTQPPVVEEGEWSFDGHANDESGNGNHGTLVNGAGYATGIIDQAVNLDGINDYVSIDSYSNFNRLDTFSLVAWIYPTQFNTHNSIISKVSPNRDFVFKLDGSGRLNAHFYDNDYRHCTSDESVALNAWSHVAAVWTGTEWELYLNGNLVKSCDHSGHAPPWTGTRMGIGTMNWFETFTGKIDEVKVYDRVLPEAAVKGHWSFNGHANDESGNGNNGTLVNGAGYATGIIDQAINLDGVNDYVKINNYSNFNGMNTFTLAAWVYPTQIKSHNSIISKVSPDRDFVFKLDGSGRLNAHFYDDGYRHCTSDQVVPLNTWTHVAAVWTGIEWKLYLNDKLVKTCNHNGYEPPWTGTRMGIGTMNWFETFTGKIDEVKIYDTILYDPLLGVEPHSGEF